VCTRSRARARVCFIESSVFLHLLQFRSKKWSFDRVDEVSSRKYTLDVSMREGGGGSGRIRAGGYDDRGKDGEGGGPVSKLPSFFFFFAGGNVSRGQEWYESRGLVSSRDGPRDSIGQM